MEKLAILDCGGQYTKVIDRRVRELGVKSDIFPINVRAEELADYKAVILSGGPNNIGESQRLNFDEKIFDSSWELAYYIWLKDHNINTVFLKNKGKATKFKMFIDYYQLGSVRFESVNVKNITYEVIQMFLS